MLDYFPYLAAPLVAPPNLSSTFGQDQIYVEWDPIPYESQGGNLVGYRITIYEYGSSSSKTDFTTPHYSRQKLITGLRGFTVYVIEVSGYTSIGNGPKSVIYDRTLNAGKYFRFFRRITLRTKIVILYHDLLVMWRNYWQR